MTSLPRLILAIALSTVALAARAEIMAGYGVADITPPAGTPSAGYGGRAGRGMTGTHDPLLATALALSNGEKTIVFCGVDHLGMIHDMCSEAIEIVHSDAQMAKVEVFIGSSHTHAGGGGFLNVGLVGTILAGQYNPEARALYVQGTARAISAALKAMEPARVGVGYDFAPGLNNFRSSWPPKGKTQVDVAVIKVTRPDGAPIACLFNFAAHPTVLSGDNMLFSADWPGYARQRVETATGAKPVYFQGAQGDVSPNPPAGGKDGFESCDLMGQAISDVVLKIWNATQARAELKIETLKEVYAPNPQGNSKGMKLEMGSSPSSEVNAVVLNDIDAFVTIPGELSAIYDGELKRFGEFLGFNHVSILGLTNDAHGYIITPEAWRHKTYESTVSFGGQLYGETVKNKVRALLDTLSPVEPEEPPLPSAVLIIQGGQ